jgi:hypothetical protein
MADSMGSNGNSLMVTLLRCASNNDNIFGSRLSDDYRFRLSWWTVLADFQRLMGQEGRPEILATTGGTGTSDVRPPIKSCFTVETSRFTQHWWAAPACYATVSTPHPWKISSDSSTWIAPQNGPNPQVSAELHHTTGTNGTNGTKHRCPERSLWWDLWSEVAKAASWFPPPPMTHEGLMLTDGPAMPTLPKVCEFECGHKKLYSTTSCSFRLHEWKGTRQQLTEVFWS